MFPPAQAFVLDVTATELSCATVPAGVLGTGTCRQRLPVSCSTREYWNTSGAEVGAVRVVVHAVPGRA